jgi:hypothetical protein
MKLIFFQKKFSKTLNFPKHHQNLDSTQYIPLLFKIGEKTATATRRGKANNFQFKKIKQD